MKVPLAGARISPLCSGYPLEAAFQLSPIDRDACSQRGGDGVGGEIALGSGRGINCFLPQINQGDIRPHSEPLSLQCFQKEAIKEIVRRLAAWYDRIHEHAGQCAEIGG